MASAGCTSPGVRRSAFGAGRSEGAGRRFASSALGAWCLLCAVLGGCTGVPVSGRGAAAHPTPAASGREAQTQSYACEVRVREAGPRPTVLLRRYDAAGRLTFGTIRLTYDGHGTETVRWGPEGMVAVSTEHAQAAREGNCDVVGGCDEPATRVFTQTEFRRRGDLLWEIVAEEAVFAETADEGWEPVRGRTLTYRLDHEHGRVASVTTSVWESFEGRALRSAGRNRVRFAYEEGHVVRRTFDDGRHRFETRYEWEGARLTSVEGTGSSHSFEYDRLGRPVWWESWSGDESAGRSRVEWHYDAHGDVDIKTETSLPRVGRPQSRVYRYEYAGPGRLARVLSDGVVLTEYAYAGTCSAVRNGPGIPDPLELTQGRFCFTSYGRLVHLCR